ncbi:undecaprenyl/decaprenyl-phosphate alpha-N-acetylglucosaminyl 1-phosphate transferase [Bdellovibrio sp. SKB1291214]|uniref:MraY family glycosyltransferase n=1 Tax=Bdellovibrio sp. SKB1291214 TaxID=1732569 RepID=UPI000B51CF99|nr:MraY family glycosyltransferase [Bdellovibrio sp. SKB1291214]UYL08288.1 undecaprenyl/decaprenyl-phosphate alpha-N-acetylglucosaminyl 1-phosphate transferase [Bdellovibrio sp. SKB1291214]
MNLSVTLWPFLVSMLIAIISIPVIIKVADLKHLMDEPDEDRKFHKTRTPTLGGIAIFAGTVFAYSAFTDYLKTDDIRFMTSAIILLFFAGIKDDIIALSPIKKLSVQVVCAILVTTLGNLKLTSFWGMFGLNEIPPIMGVLITVLVIVSLINAFNLIDGINGLAGSLGLLASLSFGIWFALTGAHGLSILAFALGGSLLGFLFFNFCNAKIFMGDTGSMLLGFIVSILAIKFIENSRTPGFETSPFYIKAAPGIAVAIVLIPLLDMTRVFFLRIIKKRSPFSADRRHIHHILQDLGMSHLQVTLSLLAYAILMIAMALYLREWRSLELSILLMGISIILTGIVSLVLKKQVRDRLNK